VSAPAGDPLRRLVAIMARLRGPDGCPWDREQTHASLTPYLVEETYELVEAVERGDADALCEELGDVLLQVVFHAQLAAEAGTFTIDDVATRIADKLVRRHPHVFGDAQVADAADVVRQWQHIKKRQEGRATFAGVPRALPALQRAVRIGDKAAHIGLDWPSVDGVLDKVDEEVAELRAAVAEGDHEATERELGDVLFALASVARHLGVDPERALRFAIDRFVQRAERVERLAGGHPEGLSAEQIDALWNQARQEPDAG